MPDFNAIADVGETMISLLREHMGSLIPPDSITLISPGDIEAKDNVRLSLFLYHVNENASLKNQEMRTAGPDRLKYPPMALDLYYMLTAHPAPGIQDKTERTREEHSILGRAIQVIASNGILKGSVLRGSLGSNGTALHISSTTMTMDDMSKLWATFNGKPFRPTICYLVTPVMVESTREEEVTRVVERKFKEFITEQENDQN